MNGGENMDIKNQIKEPIRKLVNFYTRNEMKLLTLSLISLCGIYVFIGMLLPSDKSIILEDMIYIVGTCQVLLVVKFFVR